MAGKLRAGWSYFVQRKTVLWSASYVQGGVTLCNEKQSVTAGKLRAGWSYFVQRKTVLWSVSYVQGGVTLCNEKQCYGR